MNTSISAKQLKYSVSAFLIASSLLTSNLYHFAKNDSWVSVLIGLAASIIIVGLYSQLAKRYPSLSLIEINEAVFGRFIGKAVSGLYIFYFFSLSCFISRNLGDFVKSMMLPSTPIMLIYIVFIALCAWALRKGPVVMTRYGFLLALIAVLAIAFNFILLLNKTDPKNLFPSFELPFKNYLIGAHIVTMLPLGQVLPFMMFIPYLEKPESFGRAMRSSLYIGAATLIFIVLRDIMVLGKFTMIMTMPTFSTIRLIDIGDILTRLEIIYAVILMGLLFYRASVVYFATVSGISRLFGMETYHSFIYIIGALIVIYAAASFTSGAEHAKWNLTAASTYSSFFLFVLPALTLVVAAVRGNRKNRLTKQGESG